MTTLSSKNEFENQTLRREPYVGASLKNKVFSHMVFEGCDFSQCDFTGSRFMDCKFVECNLSLAKLDGCRLQSVEFANSKLVGVNFTRCDKMFFSLKFVKSLIGTSNFSALDLRNTLFDECVIRDTYFNEANLMGADFAKSDLMGSTFHNTNLTKANFVDAMNYSIHPLTNKLTKAKFSKLEALSLLDHLDIILE